MIPRVGRGWARTCHVSTNSVRLEAGRPRAALLLVAATSGTLALNAPPRFCVPAGISAVLVSFPAKRGRRVSDAAPTVVDVVSALPGLANRAK
jgi:hypothetical protein